MQHNLQIIIGVLVLIVLIIILAVVISFVNNDNHDGHHGHHGGGDGFDDSCSLLDESQHHFPSSMETITDMDHHQDCDHQFSSYSSDKHKKPKCGKKYK
ncbi:MAG TPA: hypothetical protein VLG50_07480 [Candidatus Saccharimonadales bacterium]|nr:hypothetical protein [Candidatus Saccharimonadales bacterium]